MNVYALKHFNEKDFNKNKKLIVSKKKKTNARDEIKKIFYEIFIGFIEWRRKIVIKKLQAVKKTTISLYV